MTTTSYDLIIDVRAFHEAGHAVAHHVFGDALREVSVVTDLVASSGGHTLIYRKRTQIGPDSPKTRHQVEREVVTALAGMEAQKQYGDEFKGGGRYDRVGAANDLQAVADLAENMDWILGEQERVTWHRYLGMYTSTLVSENWLSVWNLAHELVRVECLDGKAAHRIIESA